jgi:hypothetical protein
MIGIIDIMADVIVTGVQNNCGARLDAPTTLMSCQAARRKADFVALNCPLVKETGKCVPGRRKVPPW